MRISARLTNAPASHSVTVSTDAREQVVTIPPRQTGPGSSVNGGELLFLALATCYCNDLYREAGARGLTIHEVHVEVTGHFGGRGAPATDITYRARVRGDASDADLQQLLLDTDQVAEIQNTLRQSCAVQFAGFLLEDPGRA